MDPTHHDLCWLSPATCRTRGCNTGTVADLNRIRNRSHQVFGLRLRDSPYAASDPVMWRDVFHHRDAVLEMLGRKFLEDLRCSSAVRIGDGPALEDLFTRTCAIRR